MKRILLCSLTLASPLANAADLTVQIDNVPDGGGSIMIQVLDSEAAFRDEAPAIANLILPATASSISFATSALPAGAYAIRVMHDRNGNARLDSNVVGMPTEPWGFSNNASGNFGPPGWHDARFELDEAHTQTIRLNH